jgi:hypothetical protein
MKIIAIIRIRIKVKIKSIVFFCDFSASTKADVLRHYEVSHEVDISKKTLNFNSTEEFNAWKENFEKLTKSHFIKTTRSRHAARRGYRYYNIYLSPRRLLSFKKQRF